jgi:hypothetical protein
MTKGDPHERAVADPDGSATWPIARLPPLADR